MVRFTPADGRRLFDMMLNANPGDHFHQLGMSLEDVTENTCLIRLPWAEHLIGNPDTGVVHGGVLTTMLDTCCGFAAVMAAGLGELCPTMDLRIDYMGAAEPGEPLIAEGLAYRITQHVIFTRGTVYQRDRERPVAHCVGNFSRLDPALAGPMAQQIAALLGKTETHS